MNRLDTDDYFHRMSHAEPPSEEVVANANELLRRVNAMLSDIDLPEAQDPVVTSGWRTASYNATISNAAPKSKHITGQAVDLADPEGALDEYLFAHPNRLSQAGLYMEHPAVTKNYCHLQSVPPRSGNLIFYP